METTKIKYLRMGCGEALCGALRRQQQALAANEAQVRQEAAKRIPNPSPIRRNR